MRVALDHGHGSLEIALPDGHPIDVVEKTPGPPLARPEGAIREALEMPTGTPPLRVLARGRRNAVIVVSDATRPVPNALLLPPILDALERGGIPARAVLVLVATGLHRPARPDRVNSPRLCLPRLATGRTRPHMPRSPSRPRSVDFLTRASLAL